MSSLRCSRGAGVCARLVIEMSPLQEGFRGACGATFPRSRRKPFLFENTSIISKLNSYINKKMCILANIFQIWYCVF